MLSYVLFADFNSGRMNSWKSPCPLMLYKSTTPRCQPSTSAGQPPGALSGCSSLACRLICSCLKDFLTSYFHGARFGDLPHRSISRWSRLAGSLKLSFCLVIGFGLKLLTGHFVQKLIDGHGPELGFNWR